MKTLHSNKNRHTFQLEHDGYVLSFEEWESDKDSVPDSRPYCARLSIVSYDSDGRGGYFGLGKREKNGAESFADGVEKEMLELKGKMASVDEEIRRLRRKKSAMARFLKALPKIMLEDGVDTKEDSRVNPISSYLMK